MCTAITFQSKDHYFGRNLDLEYAYEESVTVTPRNFPFHFRKSGHLQTHYALIGVAYVCEDYPLYYDATNEFGLSMAGLNFPGNAVYYRSHPDRDNITPFELIPWILGQCKNIDEAETLLNRINLLELSFSEKLPLSPLHWILADRDRCLTLESTKDGIKIYENPVGVLTNNPPFEYHLYNLTNHLNLTNQEPTNRFFPQLDLTPYSRGMGAIGMPGDLSSSSRFIRAAFTKLNAVPKTNECESISQFFHILGAVEQQEGSVMVGDKYEKTVYSSCCNTDKGIYYYKTYYNSQITAVDMHREDLDSGELISYPLRRSQNIYCEN